MIFVKVVYKTSMDNLFLLVRNLLFFLSLFFLISCKENNGKPIKTINREVNQIRLDSADVSGNSLENFLDTPFLVKENGSFDFGKNKYQIQTKTSKSEHVDAKWYPKDLDTLLTYRFTNGDIVEIFKNRFTEKIILFNISSEKFVFDNGVFIGMSVSNFNTLFNLKINLENHTYSYIDEFYKIDFIFKKGELTKIIYKSIID